MFDKLKKVFSKDEEKGSKRQIENLIVLVIILVVTVIMINNIWNTNEDQDNSQDSSEQLADTSVISDTTSEDDLQNELEDILSTMSGIEEVKVLLNYSETSSVVAMYNENTTDSSTEETDSNGGVRTITQTDVKKEVVFSDEDGNSAPVTEKVIMPKIEGAIVTVKGTMDATTKSNIISAVSAVTGLATHKIQVFSMD